MVFPSSASDDLVLPFIFVPHGGAEPPELAAFKASHPGWFTIPATFRPSAATEATEEQSSRMTYGHLPSRLRPCPPPARPGNGSVSNETAMQAFLVAWEVMNDPVAALRGGHGIASSSPGTIEEAQVWLPLLEEPPEIIRPPLESFPSDPSRAPGPGFQWRGKPGSTAGDRNGNWYNPETGETLRPDVGHSEPHGPHYDYKAPDGRWYRWFPNGSLAPKA